MVALNSRCELNDVVGAANVKADENNVKFTPYTPLRSDR